jgi:ketosteroid isomerase-like protein
MRPFERLLSTTAVAVLAAVSALASIHAQSAPGNSNSGDAHAIRAARSAQNRAIVTGDLDRVASFWTEDVTIRRALGQDVHGPAAYRELFAADKHDASSLVYQRELTRIEVSAHFPLAFETGRWTGHLGGVTGPVVIGGPYSAQWVKRADKWLIRSEVYVATTCAGVGCTYAAAP